MKNKSISFLSAYLKGVGQIMLQENVWTGLLFLAGIFYGSNTMGFAAILAALIGICTAKALKYNPENVAMGLYGFNPTLVGVGLLFYFQSGPLIWIAVITGSILATIITHLFIVNKIPGFTFPFIVVTWLFLYVFRHWLEIPPNTHLVDSLQLNSNIALPLHAFGEVIFQGSIIAGALFFIAVFVNKPIAALYGLFGAILSAALAYSLSAGSSQDVYAGLYSFNAALCGIVFSGVRAKDGVFVTASVVLAVLIQMVLLKWQVPVLTFPFVASTWLTLLLKKSYPKPTSS